MFDETLHENVPFRSLPTIRSEVVEELAARYVDNPQGARCKAHARMSRPGPCVDCAAVRRRAEELRSSRDGEAGIERDRRRAEIRACGLCDGRGLASMRFDDGTPFMVRCPHDEQELAMAVEIAADRERDTRRETRPVEVGAWWGAIEAQLAEVLPDRTRSTAIRGNEGAERGNRPNEGREGGRGPNTRESEGV